MNTLATTANFSSRFTLRKIALWLSVPILGVTAYATSKSHLGFRLDAQYDKAAPLDFTRLKTPQDIEQLRVEWIKRNNGLGLRDVSRSCGGV
ncbi:hypothetical protein G9A89_015082 [Geosiphon pyriformis]|nr:hypothetical protein G9A89_015082 [Geosiphon pyriformis]